MSENNLYKTQKEPLFFLPYRPIRRFLLCDCISQHGFVNAARVAITTEDLVDK